MHIDSCTYETMTLALALALARTLFCSTIP